jgi:hypothetical protein
MSLWDSFLSVIRGTSGKSIGISKTVAFSWTWDREDKMLATLTRTNKTSDGIFGNLALDTNPYKCVTEENLALAIPPGTYQVLYMWSENFQQIMPHIIVPNRTAIEIHWANWPKQLEGCVALGTEEDLLQDSIIESKDAWIAFVKAITDQPALALHIVEDYG